MNAAAEKAPRAPRRKAEQPAAEDKATGDLLAVVETSEGRSIAALPPAERAVIVLNSTKTEADLRAMVETSAAILSIQDKAGRELAHTTAMTLKNARVTIKNTGKAAREDATAFSAAVIAEEKRLITITEAEEERMFALRDAYDAKVAAEKAEAERIARERAASIRAAIDAVATLPGKLAGATSAQLADELQKLAALTPTAEGFDGMLAEMLLTIETVGSALHALLAGAREREEIERKRIADQEAERARLAAQAEENARIAAELERKRLEAIADAKAQAEELARLRRDAEAADRARAAELDRQREEVERARAELEAMREALKPKPAPEPEPEPAPDPEPVPGIAGTTPQGAIDWDEPIELQPVTRFATSHAWQPTITITPPAVKPAVDFALLDDTEEKPGQSPLGAFFDAVRALRHTRTAGQVRAHLEVALSDVQAEIAKGVTGYKELP